MANKTRTYLPTGIEPLTFQPTGFMNVTAVPESKVTSSLRERLPKKPADHPTGKQSVKETKSDLEHYFGQLTGTEEPDLEIVKPKLSHLKNDINTICSTMEMFAPAIRGLGYTKDADALVTFTSRATLFRDALKAMEQVELTGALWKVIKDHDFIQICMIACSNLSVIHTQFVQSWRTVDRKFMNRFTGLQFKPFMPWCEIDFKALWLIDGERETDLPELLFTVMKNLFNAMRDMYDCYMQPDVNIAHLSELIVSTLVNLRKRIPRCDKAFDKIEESARMLKDNFGDYYRDFLESKDPNNIFTAFISDVSTSCGSDTQLIFQCRKIVDFYRKNAQMKIASGEITGEKRKMFESLLNNYKMLDRNASETAGIATEGLGDAEDGEAAPVLQETPEEDARDLDELISQIENPKVMFIKDAKSKK